MYTFFERDATNNNASIDRIGESGDKIPCHQGQFHVNLIDKFVDLTNFMCIIYKITKP